MIFVDTNVFMYAVGREHPLRQTAREFFFQCVENRSSLVTSAEVLQELLHAYIPVNRIETLEAAVTLSRSLTEIWSIDAADVMHARALCDRYRALGARDLLHLACCQRRGVSEIKTFDRVMASAFD